MSSGAFQLNGDWYVRDDDGIEHKLGVMVGTMDTSAQEQMSRLVARAFVEGQAFQAMKISSALNPRFHRPWR